MKKFFSLLLISILSINCKSQNYAEIDYNVDTAYSSDIRYLILNIKVKDVKESDQRNEKYSENYDMANDIKAQLVKEFEKNQQFRIYVQYPDYMDEIINLIENSSKREQAKKILIKNLKPDAIKNSSANDFKLINGVRTKSVKVTYSIPFKTGSINKIELGELTFGFNNMEFKTRAQTILLNSK